MKSTLELSEEHIKLLGIITARWAAVDIPLWNLVALLVGDFTLGLSIYFSFSNQHVKFEVINSLLNTSRTMPEEKKERARKIVNKITDLSRARNNIIHCYVSMKIKPGQGIISGHMLVPGVEPEFIAHKHKPARGDFIKEIPLTLKFLKDHADSIEKAGQALLELVYEDVREHAAKGPSQSPSIKPPKKPKPSPEKSQ